MSGTLGISAGELITLESGRRLGESPRRAALWSQRPEVFSSLWPLCSYLPKGGQTHLKTGHWLPLSPW